MYGIFSKWRIASWQIEPLLSPSHLWQVREGKGDEAKKKKKILAVLSSSPSPSLPRSLLPGSAGRQMTSGRLITPGWVFSNLFNGSLLKKRWRRGGGRTEAGLSPSSQASRGRTNKGESPVRDTREDQTGGGQRKDNAHYYILVARNQFLTINYSYFTFQCSGECLLVIEHVISNLNGSSLSEGITRWK